MEAPDSVQHSEDLVLYDEGGPDHQVGSHTVLTVFHISIPTFVSEDE